MNHSLSLRSPQNLGRRPSSFEMPYGTEIPINLGIFSITILIKEKALELKVKLGLDPVSYEWQAFTLDLMNPSVTLTLPSTKLLGASITLSIDDATGVFTAKAKWSTLFWSDSAEISISILAPFQFGLEAVGVAVEGIKKYAREIAKFEVSHSQVTGFSNAVQESAEREGANPEQVFDFIRAQPDMTKAILSNFSKASDQELEEIGSLSVDDIELGLAAIVHDERIQHIYPGIQEKFEFREEILERIESYPFVQVGDFSTVSSDNVAAYIKEILVGFTAWLGISVTALSIVVGLYAALLGAALLTGPGVVVVVFILGILLQVLGPLCLLIWVASSIAIVAYLIIDGFIRFASLEEFNHQLKFTNALVYTS